MTWWLAFVVVAVMLGALDAIWLRSMGDRLYRRAIGPIMRDRFDGRAAGAFYLLYVVAVVVLVVRSSGSAGGAVGRGALLGLSAYGTYDLTNRATIQPFPWRLALIDLAWGTVLTAVASLAGWWAAW